MSEAIKSKSRKSMEKVKISRLHRNKAKLRDTMDGMTLKEMEVKHLPMTPLDKAAAMRYVKTEALKVKDTTKWLVTFRSRKTSDLASKGGKGE